MGQEGVKSLTIPPHDRKKRGHKDEEKDEDNVQTDSGTDYHAQDRYMCKQ